MVIVVWTSDFAFLFVYPIYHLCLITTIVIVQWNILGMMLDALPVEDEDAVCMRSQNLEPVEVDNMDLDDLSLANSFCFRLTLSSSNRCQLVSISHYIFIRLHICIDSLMFALSCT